MEDKNRSFAPGTLDQTRKNIGPIDDAEARMMQQKLGGEILPERSVPVEPAKMPHKSPSRRVIRSSGVSASEVSSQSAALSSMNIAKPGTPTNQLVSSSTPKLKKSDDDDLPPMSSRDLKLIDELMMSPEYGIKPNYGMFNIFFRMSSKNRRRLSREFGEYSIKTYLDHLQAFISTIKTFIQISPDTYKARIATDTELKFKFLRTVGKWTMHDLKIMADALQEQAGDLTVSMLTPFVCAVYHEVLTIYYIGEKKIPALIKEIFTDMTQYPRVNPEKMQELAKQAITEWLYVYDQIVKGMYPLLMRMCGTEYAEFPRFFTSQVAQILQFVGLSKFDILVPEKKPEAEAAEEEKAAGEAEKKKEEQRHIAGQKDEIVDAGLKILEQLFPQAGFSQLDKYPDMFPYFQPLYKFDDGFNMLSPKNGLQVTVVLLKIIDDLFHGCRNIQFNFKADEVLGAMPDNITDVINHWNFYGEDLFNKKYGDYLREFVNAVYLQKDYANTQYGKESLNNILWRTKYYFLPNFKFSAPILAKPINDSKYRPLCARTDYVRSAFTVLARRIDENQAGKKTVLGVVNPWDRYVFDIPNTVSRRLDVLLGAKRDNETTAATNANLIKYTLCIMSVLDWWVNNAASPANTSDPSEVYRTSDKDGAPEFSVPQRSDQNQLFADGVKKAVAARQK